MGETTKRFKILRRARNDNTNVFAYCGANKA